MVNYSLVVNSKFQPFSFERYIQPYQLYGQAYKEVENQYLELATKANVWEEMANEQTDPYAYKMYKTFANDLEEKAGQLAREGLNATNRRGILNMRTRYSKEITPIEQAYTARQKQAEAQQQALLQDPTLMFSRKAATTSLDDYIKNPQLSYDPYSGKMLTAQVAQAASALAKQVRDNPRKWRSILSNSYYETLMQKGFKTQDVLNAILNNPEAAPELLKIVEDAINSSGIKNWNDPSILERAYEYARQGLWSAVGETQYQTLDNWRAKMAEQEAMQRRLQREANKSDTSYGGRVVPVPLRSTTEISKEKALLDKYIKSGHLKKTLKGLIPTKKAQEELRMDYYYKTHPKEYAKYKNKQMRKVAGEPIASNSIMNSRYSPFADWYNAYIGGYDAKRNVFVTPTTRLNKYVGSLNEDTYDVYHTTGYEKQFDSKYGKEYLTTALGATSNDPNKQELKVVEWTGDGYKPTGETLSADDLEGAYIGAIRSTGKGRAGRVVLKNNKTVTVEMPSIFEAAERNSITYSRLANMYSQIGNQKYKPVLDSNGYPVVDKNGNIKYTKQLLTDRDRAIVLDNADKNARMVNLYEGQVFMPGSSSDSEDNPWM